MTRMCCQCHKVEQDGSWAASDRLPGWTEQVSHGYCPECYDKALVAIEQYIESKRLASVCYAMPVAMITPMRLCA